MIHSFGSFVSAFDDLDGDGVTDVLIGAGAYQGAGNTSFIAEARGYSSVTGELHYRGAGHSWSNLAVVPDANGGGRADYLIPGYISAGGWGATLVIVGFQAPRVVKSWRPSSTPRTACPCSTTRARAA